MDRIVAFARHVKKDLPADLNATGEAEAAFEVLKTGRGPGDGPAEDAPAMLRCTLPCWETIC